VVSEVLVVLVTAVMTILAAAVIVGGVLLVLGFLVSAPIAAVVSGAHQHEDRPKVHRRHRIVFHH